MKTRALAKFNDSFPSLVEDFFKPWNDWLPFRDSDFTAMTMPAVNVAENKNSYELTLAAPGMKKNDFKIDVEGNTLTISSEKEETKEEKDEKYSRKEYNYSSFCRSFTLPDTVSKEKIDAKYENGILTLVMPKKEEAVKAAITKSIEVK